MNKSIKKILFVFGIIISLSLLVGVFWVLVNKTINILPKSISYLLIFIGSYLFIIIPVTIILFLKYKESKKKLSENQEILKSASIWAFIIMAFFRLINLLIT